MLKIISQNSVETRDFNAAPILLSDLERAVPSIVADEPHESRSARYGFVSTLDILMGLRDRFAITKAMQSRVRDNSTGRREYTKHMIRLRARDAGGVPELGGVFPELVLINSHDGTSSYQLMAGLFRLVCANGMVVCSESYGSVRIPHRDSAVKDVIDASFTVVSDAQKTIERAKAWRGIELSPDERIAFAEAVHEIRFADSNAGQAITPRALLSPRRSDDVGPDLWSITNRLQENAIKGGLSGFARGSNGRMRRAGMRSISGVDQDVRLNRAIWAFAEKLAEMHSA
jgi:Domain of unknown function (DUF932)